MSRQIAPQSRLVKREEKETKLKAFILQHLEERRGQGPADATEMSCLLIARSAESPVAKTVLSMGASSDLKGFTVRAIFANLGTAETARIAEACLVSDWALQIRWARDLRLLEAHEQLVIGSATSWTGDCMRREPMSRDACETYAAGCPETAQRVALFFERIWQASEPIFERQGIEPAAAPDPAVPPAEQLPADGGATLDPRTAMASGR